MSDVDPHGDVEVRRGDVVVVSLAETPQPGREITRQAVVVQNDVGNRHGSTTVVAPATGTYRGYPFEVGVGGEGTPFTADSSVRLDQLRTVSIDERVESVVGRLDAATMADVDEALKLSLGLE